MQTTILVNVTSEVQSQNLEINSEILKEKNEKEKISSHVSITDPAVLARFLSFEMLSYGMYLLSFGMYSLSFGMYFFSFEIFFQEIHIRALENSGTHDTTHKQTSRTSIRWDKLRCNHSSKKEKRLALKLEKPLKTINKCKFLRNFSYMMYTKIFLNKKALFSFETKSLMQKCFRILSYIISATKYTMSFSND